MRNRLAGTPAAERAYQLYVTLLVAGAAAVPIQSGLRNQLTTVGLDQLMMFGPPAIGSVLAAAVVTGAMAGQSGAPYTPTLATVHHELRAPIDVAVVLRAELSRRLRAMAALGGLWGAVVGLVTAALLDAGAPRALLVGTLSGAAGAVLAGGAAALVASIVVPEWLVTLFAAPIIAWSGWDLWLGQVTSPLSRIGRATMLSTSVWPIVALVGAAAVVVTVAFARVRHVPMARLVRRAGLTAQVRFAASLLDFRTVVLLRRSSRPWAAQPVVRRLPVWLRATRLRRAVASWSIVGRRGLVRGGLAVVIVAALVGAALEGRPIATAVAALMLVPIGYRLAEPISQELDHPSRWFGHPTGPLRHLGGLAVAAVPAAVLMLVAGTPVAVLMGASAPTAALFLAVIAVGTVMTGVWSSIFEPPDLIAAALMGEMGGAFVAMRATAPLVPLAASLGLPAMLLHGGTAPGVAVSSTVVPLVLLVLVTALRLRSVRPWA